MGRFGAAFWQGVEMWEQRRPLERPKNRGDIREAPRDDTREPPEDAAGEENRQLIDELRATVEGLQAKAEVLADALRLPGVKLWLLAKFHPDKHPQANEAERAVHTQNFQKVNAAYEMIERGQ
jgi:hypothetical protein